MWSVVRYYLFSKFYTYLDEQLVSQGDYNSSRKKYTGSHNKADFMIIEQLKEDLLELSYLAFF